MPTPDRIATLVFRRDDDFLRGCIEFSWVPTGMRRQIILPPGVPQGVDSFSYPFDPHAPSVLQIYVLNNDGKGGPLSFGGGNFPPGTGTASPIVVALAEVFAGQHALRLTFDCEDGSIFQNWVPLDKMPRMCPMQRTKSEPAAPSKRPKKA